jgi:hypothetical protein
LSAVQIPPPTAIRPVIHVMSILKAPRRIEAPRPIAEPSFAWLFKINDRRLAAIDH